MLKFVILDSFKWLQNSGYGCGSGWQKWRKAIGNEEFSILEGHPCRVMVHLVEKAELSINVFIE